MRHGRLAQGMRPAFEYQAVIKQGVEIRGIVKAGARKHDEVVAAGDNADGIELEQADALDDAQEVGRRGALMQALFVNGEALDGVAGDGDWLWHGGDCSMLRGNRFKRIIVPVRHDSDLWVGCSMVLFCGALRTHVRLSNDRLVAACRMLAGAMSSNDADRRRSVDADSVAICRDMRVA